MQDGFQKKGTGLVLSGGGVRGMAHIGLLQAMEENNLRPDRIAGSSVGALVGALYAAGLNAREMLSFFRATPLFKYNFFALNKPGLMNTDRYIAVFRDYFPEDRFEALALPLYVVATNLLKGEFEIFSKGELIRPLLASAALPPVFSPVDIGGQLYSDGGIMNNFPSEAIAPKSDFLIGSNVSVIGEIGPPQLKTSIQLTNRTTALMIYSINQGKMKNCDLLFQPPALERIGVLDKKGLEEAYQIGYEHACELLDYQLGVKGGFGEKWLQEPRAQQR